MFLHPLQSAIAPPPKFTYPFCYEPHPLCLQAAAEVQGYIASEYCWREEISRGKMFGVLVVAVPGGGMAYLAAYSGQLCGRNDWPFFVPAVFDILQPGGYFKEKEGEITAINARLAELEAAGCRVMRSLYPVVQAAHKGRRITTALLPLSSRQPSEHRTLRRTTAIFYPEDSPPCRRRSQGMRSSMRPHTSCGKVVPRLAGSGSSREDFLSRMFSGPYRPGGVPVQKRDLRAA